MSIRETKKPAEDDPRLTAYALGELSDSERKTVEALLRSDPAARRAVEEIRETARILQAELAREPGLDLLPEQRNAIEAAAGEPRSKARLSRRVERALAVAGGTLAATVVVALAAWFWRTTPAQWGGRELATASARKGGGDRSAIGGSRRPAPASADAPLVGNQEALGEMGYVVAPTPLELPPDAEWRRLDEFEDGPDFDTEAYDRIVDNPFLLVRDEPLSTFSIDVDTASYANVRRFLAEGRMPPPDAVRIEELVNYFPYRYEGPRDERPFAVHVETAECPWAPKHRLVRIGLKGREIGEEGRRPSNLVFLIDVSGSMDDPLKLPLLKSALQMLVQELDERDRVAIVVYAGAAGLVLPSTSAEEKRAISEALERLEAGGSTAGGAGIELAYQVAVENFLEEGVNRVLLATDGDFNVGISDDGSLTRLIEEKRKSGVFLSVLGFGTGNLKDAKLEKLADQGNGSYAYVDSLLEAQKVLVEELGATLETIAKDVKIQVEFNPLEVEGYRLIGYENRLLAAQDFNDDAKDAGEIGAGHTVTALYEVVPAGLGLEVPGVGPLKYQTPAQASGAALSGELFTLKLRYKAPDEGESQLIELPVRDEGGSFDEASEDLRFATAVAAFGMKLRGARQFTLEDVLRWASGSVGDDPGGYRRRHLELVRGAMAIDAASLREVYKLGYPR